MKIEIKVPAMGESISEATIGNILKPSGSKVNADDEILELETDKVNQVIYAPQSGIVTFTVNQGQTVKIGEVIGALEAVQGQTSKIAKTKETAKKEAKPSVSL